MNIEYFKSLKSKYSEYDKEISWIVGNGFSCEGLRDKLISDQHYDDAVNLVLEHLKCRRDIASSHILVAKTYEKLGDISSAIKTYENAIEGEFDLATQLYKNYAKLAENFYEKEKVIDIYRSFVEKKQSFPVHRGFFEFLLEKNELDCADIEAKKLIHLYHDKKNSLNFLLSELYEKKGEFGNAKSELKKLIDRNINNGMAWKKLKKLETSYPDNNSSFNIIRMIEFSPEYHSAGISILQSFGKLLREKYKGSPVKVTIVQEGLAVKMIVVPPDGKKMEVEEYLHQYGLVIKGDILPEQLLSDPVQIIELKMELKLAHTRIELQRDQMQFIESQNVTRISSLEAQVNWLRDQVGSSLGFQRESYRGIFDSLSHANENSNDLLNKLIKAIEKDNSEDAKNLLKDFEEKEPENYSKVKQFISNTTSSAGANAPAWVDFISRVMPIQI